MFEFVCLVFIIYQICFYQVIDKIIFKATFRQLLLSSTNMLLLDGVYTASLHTGVFQIH